MLKIVKGKIQPVAPTKKESETEPICTELPAVIKEFLDEFERKHNNDDQQS